jgi:hypothetical protein
MVVTVCFPRAAAEKLNLGSPASGVRLTVTLTVVELAGRLTLATGRTIAPEAVERYCSAWRAAKACVHALVERHGPTQLADMIRKGCTERSLWLPEPEEEVLLWLEYVLLAHFCSPGALEKASPPHDMTEWACLQTAGSLSGLCAAHFPQAYRIWVEDEGATPPSDDPDPELA